MFWRLWTLFALFLFSLQNAPAWADGFDQLSEKQQDFINQILIQTPPERLTQVRSSLASFAFLDQNAVRIAKIPEAQLDQLTNRIHDLFSRIDQVQSPDCPETEAFEESASPEAIEEVQFQKINRYLFAQLDDEILNMFRGSDWSDFGEFAFPVVEWAENLVPDFTLELIRSHEGETLEDKLIQALKNKYHPDLTKNYVRRAFKAFMKESENSAERPALINKLRCTMCYPVRVSILE